MIAKDSIGNKLAKILAVTEGLSGNTTYESRRDNSVVKSLNVEANKNKFIQQKMQGKRRVY